MAFSEPKVRMKLTNIFCRCIQKVRKSLSQTRRKDRVGRSIGICVRSVLQTRGKTLKYFNCGKHRLVTQPLKK